MRAFVVDHDAGVRDWPEPTAAAGEILVEPLLVGVCGTDLEIIDHTIDPAYVRHPLVIGHEWVGRLREGHALGPTGTHVVVEGVLTCGRCPECRRGDTNRCVVYDEIGFTRPGALADLVKVPACAVHVLAEHVSNDDAVLVEPMAVVWRALTRLAIPDGARVAVVGDGTVALLTAHLVRRFAPSRVVVVGRRGAQRDLALRAGADDFLITPPPETFDLVIEAAGVATAVSDALSLAARGAQVILLGLPAHGTTVPLAPDHLVNNDIILQGSFSYTRAAWAAVVELVNRGELSPGFLITHRFSLDDADDAVRALRGPLGEAEPRGKVVVRVRD
ncbi:MAG TPA: alcohol dehydrogenase catalytic domain-containing protein [Acidimicrobiales bacterium]|nr:alcohol dehydrogenase catalytic domain-containing protein [Acidimicrobiales bacterium]